MLRRLKMSGTRSTPQLWISDVCGMTPDGAVHGRHDQIDEASACVQPWCIPHACECAHTEQIRCICKVSRS
jgi:hypothetical protein